MLIFFALPVIGLVPGCGWKILLASSQKPSPNLSALHAPRILQLKDN